VARLSVAANREARPDLTTPVATALLPLELSAPDLALRLLEDLDDGHLLYVAERDCRIVGFAQLTGLMVGDGGHLVELRRLYVLPEQRGRGWGRQLLRLVRHELAQRQSPPALRAWAPAGSPAADFLEAAGAAPSRPRWKVGPGDMAVKGTVYGWSPARPVAAARARAAATAR
jgi:GNAT superfamily N-acetyltransferase